LRPVLGPNSVLTANGPGHLRQRKMLLPQFHGEAIARYEGLIAEVSEREIATWRVGRRVAIAPRMQAVTLDVIMGGIFGIEGRPRRGTLEHALRLAIRALLWTSMLPIATVAELANLGRSEPTVLTRIGLLGPDRLIYALIAKRRRAEDLEERRDILSLLLASRDEDGEALGDRELRDELLTLVLAGHETTANQIAWTWERLLRAPAAYERLREAVRSGIGAEEQVEATILEAMRTRPVVPMIGRRVAVPWRLGPYGVPADTPVAISILLLHHREDVYPDPFAFRPERWFGHKPGTYEWIPFGGGTRRCLGAALAMAEQRVILRAMAATLELEADDPAPERPKHHNVTMVPARGGRAVLRGRV
jgi:cytochrome P450